MYACTGIYIVHVYSGMAAVHVQMYNLMIDSGFVDKHAIYIIIYTRTFSCSLIL